MEIAKREYSKNYPESTRKWRKKNRDKVLQERKRYLERYEGTLKLEKRWQLNALHTKYTLRNKFFEMYGCQCMCCGEKEKAFLVLDHIENDGCEHRKEVGNSLNIYRDAIKKYRPDRFQVLCFNCNMAKQTLGQCPHHDSHEGLELGYNVFTKNWELVVADQGIVYKAPSYEDVKKYSERYNVNVRIKKDQISLCHLEELILQHGEEARVSQVANKAFLDRSGCRRGRNARD